MRAWIETDDDIKPVLVDVVALHVRAWIETFFVYLQQQAYLCRPSCEGVD